MPDIASAPRLGEDSPILELRTVGNGRSFVRALARIIVRRELISIGLIPDPDPCLENAQTG
jgi:hypothetical protein